MEETDIIICLRNVRQIRQKNETKSIVKSIFHRYKKSIIINDIDIKKDLYGNKGAFQNCYHKDILLVFLSIL